MKRLLILLVLLVAGCGLFLALWSGQEYANYPPAHTGPWVAFGDSLTSGYGASDGNDYPALLGKRLSMPVLNRGTPGATTQDAVIELDEILRLRPAVVLLCFGGNDSLKSVPHERTFQNLSFVIDQLHHSGACVVLIGIRSANLRDQYRSQFKKLAKTKRVPYLPNILDDVLGNPGLMSDYVHPNDQGYAAITDRIVDFLRPLLPGLMPAQSPN